MRKLTLLEMTQKILNSMDSDDVNSISDTEEALQVVELIEDTFSNLMTERDWSHLKQNCNLEGLSDGTKPNFLRVPDDVAEVQKVSYNVTKTGDLDQEIRELLYKHPDDFLACTYTRNTSDTTITIVKDLSGVDLWIINNEQPTFWTSFDNTHIVTDAFDSAEETTLIGSKSSALCVRYPTFTKSDTFIPDIPAKMFPLLLSDSKRICHLQLKQQDSPLDAKNALKGRNRMNREDWRTHDSKRRLRFGRK